MAGLRVMLKIKKEIISKFEMNPLAPTNNLLELKAAEPAEGTIRVTF